MENKKSLSIILLENEEDLSALCDGDVFSLGGHGLAVFANNFNVACNPHHYVAILAEGKSYYSSICLFRYHIPKHDSRNLFRNGCLWMSGNSLVDNFYPGETEPKELREFFENAILL